MKNDFNFFSIRLYKIEIHSFIYSFIHSFIHSFTRLLVYSFTRLLTRILSFIHSFIHSFTRSFIHSLIMPPKLKIKTDVKGIGAATTTPATPATPSSQFISSLSPLEQRVCAIAESHLESSFDLSRSSGFIAWKAKNAWPCACSLYNIADVFHHLFACFTYLSDWLFILAFVFFDGT